MLDWYLKQWLDTLKLSQADLVRLSDYPKAKISNLVTGEQRYNRDIINDLSAAMNIQPHELLMHPDDAMAIRRMRRAVEEMVQIPFGGVAGDGEPEEEESVVRRA